MTKCQESFLFFNYFIFLGFFCLTFVTFNSADKVFFLVNGNWLTPNSELVNVGGKNPTTFTYVFVYLSITEALI